MKKRIAAWTAALALVLPLALSSAMAKDLWIHIRVEEKKTEPETVRINVPISMIESLAPVMQDIHVDTEQMKLGEKNIDAAKLREIWKAVRTAEDGEYVTVESEHENVRVAKSGDYLLVKARDGKDRPENVDVKIPLAVVDALFSGTGDELNFVAAIQALKARGEGELVSVSDPDTNVRIWIDGNNSEK